MQKATLNYMAFSVNQGPVPPLTFGDNERFEIVDGGVLKIYRADGTNFYINPSTWVSIEEMRPPGTGANGTPVAGKPGRHAEVAPEDRPV